MYSDLVRRPFPSARQLRSALLMVLATVFISPALTAQPKPPTKFDGPSALNMAFRQPMLAERITKSFSLIGQNVLVIRSKRNLEDAIREFQSALQALQSTAPTAEIRENYQLLEQLFGEFKELTGRPVNLENARQLAEQNEELVWIAAKGAGLLQAYTRSERSDLIATASDLRILTQRIAKLYLFRSWGIRSDVIANDLKKAEADYRIDIAKLMSAPQNTAQINSELALAETQYLFLKQGIERLNANKASPTELEYMAKACDNILEVMERVTRLYEGLQAWPQART
jgi:hypothetical protein